jgi:hypothetical protein
MIEQAVTRVRELSTQEVRELLGWMKERKTKPASRRKSRSLLAWSQAVRGTTDWQPARMPDDLVNPRAL